MARVRILNVETEAQPFEDAIHKLARWAMEPGQHYVCACPVYTLTLADEHAALRGALEGADMVTADGMPVVWMQRRMGYPEAERVYGPDMLLALCERTKGRGVKHFFYGGLPGVPERLCEAMLDRFPQLEVAGTAAPPVRELETTPDAEVIALLNNAAPDVIWVGLGSPKQDMWMALYRPHLNAPLLIGVGAAFDFFAGTKKQAPLWMRERGLEWLFRFAQEPRRLWKRYLVYNTVFVWRTLGVWLRGAELGADAAHERNAAG